MLDEADRMLDMGFIHDVKKVLALVPKNKQSLLFSATFSDDIRELAGTLLKNPQSIQVTPRNTTVQRITQIIHPVGRRKKKEALLHIIQEHNWSQVLVFTRTKFGANHVAEYLTKHGVTAMALHGNKSQSARTQALAGFKTGELRALVATDIAARGIDIDELPHVVNYEIPNVPEDYVHRIGRTGRAGREGHAVSMVCLDEEGFMMEIERFTKQEIPVQVLPDFGPEEGEKAEPIAMGRQTIWGGAGKPPSREVMQAAAKAARQEMMERIRSTKTAQPNRGGGRGGRKPVAEAAAQASGEGHPDQGSATPGDTGPRRGGQGYNRSRQRPGRSSSTRPGEGLAPMRESRPPRTSTSSSHNRPPRSEGPDYEGGASSRFEFQPPTDAHLGTQLGRPRKPARAGGSSGQPDPTRTSVDLMVDRPRRGGPGFSGGPGFAGNRRRSGGGGGNFGR